MSARVFRAKKSEWLLWVFYFLAFFTAISFVIIFSRFFVKATLEVFAHRQAADIVMNLYQTLKILGFTYLWVLPWAALLTVFYFMDEQDWKRHLGTLFIKFFLRIPPLAIGVMVFFLMKGLSQDFVMSIVIGLIALPRLVFGWIGIVKKTSSDLYDTALSLGMSQWQLLKYVYLKREGLVFSYHILRVTCLLIGAVAPFIYLSDLSSEYLSLTAFRGLVENPSGSPVVWSSLLLLFISTVLLTPSSEKGF